MASPSSAALAYANLARLTDPASAARAGSDAGSGFASLLKDALNAVNETGHKSDAQAQALVAGKANIVDVVTAVAESEVAIDAVVSVRDKVIQAYEDIMKMPI
ncbi:MAG TPA: flagellar hook-basal body complex protein FliE [Xanthobacteraceae bacterium]|nr:flagellar hook-basal body complex protein FliE [Xanthobacteraceae bacterium]